MSTPHETPPPADLTVPSAELYAQLARQQRQIRMQQRRIEAQHRQIETLRTAKDQVESIFRSTSQSFILFGADGIIRAANATFQSVAERLFGAQASPGDPIEQYVRDEDLDSFRANTERALGGETVVVTKHFDVTGVPRWFRFTYTPVYEGDAVGAVILNAVDVTEQKIAEQALTMSSEQYRSIVHDVLDASAAGLFILDAAFTVVWINEAVERFFGIRRADVLGRDKRQVLRRTIAPLMADSEAFTARVEATYADNTYTEQFNCHVTPGAGRVERELEHRSLPIQTGWYAGGRIEHYYDVTPLKQTEAQLREAKREAEAASETKSRFLATVSHEIRSPMSGILGFADLLADKDLDAESQRFARIIHDSGTRLLALLDDVLDLARLEADAVDIERRPFALRTCLIEAVEIVSVQAEGKNLDLQVDVAPTLPAVIRADELRLRQVLVNLLSNAVKFTGDGRVELRVAIGSSPWPRASANAWTPGTLFALHVCVSDTGIGIDPAAQADLFRPFHQVDVSTSREYGGTGLGLSIVARLVDAMGGGVWVESEPGVGSDFHVSLPVTAESCSAGGTGTGTDNSTGDGPPETETPPSIFSQMRGND